MKMIFAVIAFVVAGGIFFLYTKPAYDGLQSTQTQIAQYNAALQKATELQQLKQSLLSRYNAFNPNDLNRLQKMLPDHVDNIALILDIDNLARRYGLALENVDVSSPSSVSTASTPVGAIGSSSQKYDSLTIKFSTNGGYSSFVKFLGDLESSLRIVDLESLSIQDDTVVRNGKSTTPQTPVYHYDIMLRTYWLK